MQKQSFLYVIFLICCVSLLMGQQNRVHPMQQDYDNFQRERELEFLLFKERMQHEIQAMEREYQQYYNGLLNIRDEYVEKKDTAMVNVVSDMIEVENAINKVAGNTVYTAPSAAEATPVPPPAPSVDPPSEQPLYAPGEKATVPSLAPAPQPMRITSPFGVRRHPILRRRIMHNGIDVGVPSNTNIFASADGKVSLAKYSRSYGNWIIIDHENGYQTVYAHLNSFKIREGQSVKAGDVIALSGSTGRSTGPHLHYEVRHNGTPVNPQSFIGQAK